MNVVNDSIDYIPSFSFNGVYTIGGSNADFPTFLDAVTQLNLRGVCGPVTFNVRQGQYGDRIQINALAGSSVTNFVTFRPDPANTLPVELVVNGEFNYNRQSHYFLKRLKQHCIP